MSGKPENFRLLSDEPACEFQRRDELLFGRDAEVLAGAALQSDGPITIGVFGNWGTGKTSLMRLMVEKVNEHGKFANLPRNESDAVHISENLVKDAAVPVWFNAWQYERDDHLIVPLIATIAREVDRRRKEWERIKLQDNVDVAAKKAWEKLKRGTGEAYDLLQATFYGLSVKGKLSSVPTGPSVEIGASGKDVVERYKALKQDALMEESLYFHAFDKLRAMAEQKGEEVTHPKIVVFVDDLDRCFPEKAVELLESIKLVLHIPGFAFVLGIYDKIIEEFIRNKYLAEYPLAAIKATSGEKDGGDGHLRQRMNDYLMYFDQYLDKIIQVRHHVPERKPEQMRKYVARLLEDAGVASEFGLSGGDGPSRNALLELIAEVGERNPRGIVRKLNGLIVRWRIAGGEDKFNLLSGLIHEAYLDRVTRERSRYHGFVVLLDRAFRESTYGDILAFSINSTEWLQLEYDGLIEELKNAYRVDSGEMGIASMCTLVETLAHDRSWCSVLRTAPGLQWLRDKSFREGASEAFGDDGYRAHELETSETSEYTLIVPGRFRIGQDQYEPLLAELRLREIPGGTFLMGSPPEEAGRYHDEFQHEFKLDPYHISAVPVTQRLYEAIMDTNPSYFNGTECPVEQVSWIDAMAFCEQLTVRLENCGFEFMLPTEAQWEFACRAYWLDENGNLNGVDGAFCFGHDVKELGDYAWYAENADGRTHPVGEKRRNDFGLYDMHGNVWEWCRDLFTPKYHRPEATKFDLLGSDFGAKRVIRGGTWDSLSRDCRSARRSSTSPDKRGNFLGFRVVAVPQRGRRTEGKQTR